MTRATVAGLGLGLCLATVGLLLFAPSKAPPLADDGRVAGSRAQVAAPAGNEPDFSSTRRESDASAAVPRCRLEGRVAEPSGRGVAGASLRLIVDRSGGDTELSRTMSGDDGWYTLDLAPVCALRDIERRSAQFGLDVSATGYLPAADVARIEDVTDDRAAVRQDVVLRPGLVVAGRVLDEAGMPVASAFVRLCPGEAHGDDARSSTWTDGDGGYRLAMPPGRLLGLTALRDDLGYDRLDGLAPLAGRDFAAPDLVLRPVSDLAGVVVYRDGQPVAGAALQVESDGAAGDDRDRGAEYGRTITGADGAFRFRSPSE